MDENIDEKEFGKWYQDAVLEKDRYLARRQAWLESRRLLNIRVELEEGVRKMKPDPAMQGFYVDPIIKKLEARIKELEERTARAETEGGWAVDPNFYVEKTKLDEADARVKELEDGIEKYLDNPEFDTEILTRLINKEKS